MGINGVINIHVLQTVNTQLTSRWCLPSTLGCLSRDSARSILQENSALPESSLQENQVGFQLLPKRAQPSLGILMGCSVPFHPGEQHFSQSTVPLIMAF